MTRSRGGPEGVRKVDPIVDGKLALKPPLRYGGSPAVEVLK